jgi:hypothetical protein
LTPRFIREEVVGGAEGLFVTSDAACAFDSHGVAFVSEDGVAFFASFGANSTETGGFIGIGVRRTHVSKDTGSEATVDTGGAGRDDVFDGEVGVIHVSSIDHAVLFVGSGFGSKDDVEMRGGLSDDREISPEEASSTGLPVAIRLKSAFGTGHTVLMTLSAFSSFSGEVEVVSFLAGGAVERGGASVAGGARLITKRANAGFVVTKLSGSQFVHVFPISVRAVFQTDFIIDTKMPVIFAVGT